MIHRRILYGELLAGAVLFQIFFRFYFSTFLLVLLLVLPLFSLLLSLPTLALCSFTLCSDTPAVSRGEKAAFRAVLHNPSRLPLSWLRVRLSWENSFTGERGGERHTLSGASQGAHLLQEVSTAHCGRVVCRAERPRACDLLGLFSLPVKVRGETALLVLPLSMELDAPEESFAGLEGGSILRPRPGGGPGEDYDLRAYRAGDPLRCVHWKLSSKLDELVVRETLEPQQAALVLTFDHFGPVGEMDRTLDRLYSLSALLLRRERPHHIQWAHPVSGVLEDCPVDSERALLTCLERVCSSPAPLEGRSILDGTLRIPGSAGRVCHLHVTAGGVEGGGV